MAGRNPSKGMPWFKHDTGYASDEDIEVLIANFGQDGYAYPLHMYELAYNTRDGELSISAAEKQQVYAKRCLISFDLWKKITQAALKYGIWDPEAYKKRQVLTSDRIKETMRPVLEHRERAKKTYNEKRTQKATPISAAETTQKPRRIDTEESREEKSKTKGKGYVPPPEALRLAGVLAGQIIKSNPSNRELSNGKRDASVRRWAKDIDIMLRKDNRDPADVQRVILWAHQDTFWYKNILSGATLRDKYDRLIMDMKPARPPQADEKDINYEAVEAAMAKDKAPSG